MGFEVEVDIPGGSYDYKCDTDVHLGQMVGWSFDGMRPTWGGEPCSQSNMHTLSKSKPQIDAV